MSSILSNGDLTHLYHFQALFSIQSNVLLGMSSKELHTRISSCKHIDAIVLMMHFPYSQCTYVNILQEGVKFPVESALTRAIPFSRKLLDCGNRRLIKGNNLASKACRKSFEVQ